HLNLARTPAPKPDSRARAFGDGVVGITPRTATFQLDLRDDVERRCLAHIHPGLEDEIEENAPVGQGNDEALAVATRPRYLCIDEDA
ncbi:hypothetical protein VNI00_012848, partial [Paramarasmius palmivorus]